MSESPVLTLERWEQGGATWRARHVSEDEAVVELCTCTGEPVEELRSGAPALLALLARRPRSEAPD